MITPSFVTPKYCVPFLLALCLVVVALHKASGLPSSEANLSLFGVTLLVANGKLTLTQDAKPVGRNLFSITSHTPTRFNVTVLDTELVHACPKYVVWVALFLTFAGMATFRFTKK